MNKMRFNKEHPAPVTWQVWLAYVHFEGNEGGKKRPVLVIETRGSSCTIAEITSKPPTCLTDIPISDTDTAGLGRESVIQTRKTRTISKTNLKSYLGALSYSDRNAVKDIVGRRGFN